VGCNNPGDMIDIVHIGDGFFEHGSGKQIAVIEFHRKVLQISHLMRITDETADNITACEKTFNKVASDKSGTASDKSCFWG
jgi:hypothetical protein